MAEQKSVEYTAIANTLTAYAPLRPNQLGGRVRMAYFSFNTTTAPLNINDTIKLTKLPAGARVIGGRVAFGAMGANAVLDIGDGTSSSLFLAAGNVAAAGVLALNDTVDSANGALGTETAAEVDVIGTATGANYAAAKDVKGYILYVLD